MTVGPTEAFYRIFRPFIAAFTWLTNVSFTLMRIEPASEHDGAITAEELELMVQTSHRAGALEDTERDLLSNVFDFADLSVLSGDGPAPRHGGRADRRLTGRPAGAWAR